MNSLLPILLLLTSMVSIQIGASLAHRLFDIFGVGMSTVLRLVISTLILTLIYRPKLKNFFNPRSRFLMFYGLSLGLMNLSFYYGLHLLPLGVAVSIEFLGPLCLAILTSRKRIDLLWVGFSLTGFIVFLPFGSQIEALSLKGILFAALAGFFWAMYILMGRRTDPGHSSGSNTAVGMLIASLVVIPFGLGDLNPSLFSFPHLAIATTVAILSSAIPYTLEMFALKKLSTRTFSILLSLEPGIAACMGFIFIGEKLSFVHSLGMLCLMIACAGSALTDYQDQKVAP